MISKFRCIICTGNSEQRSLQIIKIGFDPNVLPLTSSSPWIEPLGSPFCCSRHNQCVDTSILVCYLGSWHLKKEREVQYSIKLFLHLWGEEFNTVNISILIHKYLDYFNSLSFFIIFLSIYIYSFIIKNKFVSLRTKKLVGRIFFF